MGYLQNCLMFCQHNFGDYFLVQYSRVFLLPSNLQMGNEVSNNEYMKKKFKIENCIMN